MSPVLVRAIEVFVTYFVVTFATLATGVLGSVDISDHKAVMTALTTAAIGALVAALKQVTGVTKLDVKPPTV